MAKTTKKQPKTVAETPSDLADDIFNESLTFIRDEIRAIKDGKAKSKKFDPASRIAWLAERASRVQAERRKAESAEAANLRKLSRALVVAWLKQLDAAERAQVIREATATDRGGSVLS